MKTQDEQHLDILAILHYVFAGLMALFGFFPFIHVGMGVFILRESNVPSSGRGSPPPPGMAYLFILMGLLFIVLLWTLAVLAAVTGRNLKRRKNRMFCLIVAGVECLNTPLGTILGVFTIIVLCKPNVVALFEGRSPISGLEQADFRSYSQGDDDVRVIESGRRPQ